MKAKRHKEIRSHYQFYQLHFDFKTPQKFLFDGNFLKVCIDIGFDYFHRLHSIFGLKLEFWTTSCVQKELRELGSELEGVFQASFRLKRFNCPHAGLGMSAGQCIKSVVGRENEGRFIVATQDPDLWAYFGKTVGVPVMVFSHGILKLKEPTEVAKRMVEAKDAKKGQLNPEERKEIERFRREEGARERKIEKDRLKFERNKLCIKPKKSAKGPNPLSMKRKKPEREIRGAAETG